MDKVSVPVRTYTAREIIRLLQADGWYEVRQAGSHKQFKHLSKPGKVTVPMHSGDLDQRTVRSIFKQAQIREE